MNTDIRYKYVYQNLLTDKIDLINKWPPVPLSLPPWKTLDPKCIDPDVNVKNEQFSHPYLYDYKTHSELDA